MPTPSEEARLKTSLQRQLVNAMKERLQLEVDIATLDAAREKADQAFLSDPGHYKRRAEQRRAAIATAVPGGFLGLSS